MELNISFDYINEKDWDPNDNDKIVMGEEVQINLIVANQRSDARLAYQWNFGNNDLREFGVATNTELKAFGNFSDCTSEYDFTITVQDSIMQEVDGVLVLDEIVEVTETFTVPVYRRPSPVLSDLRNGNNPRDQFSNCAAFSIEDPRFEIEAGILSNDNCIVGNYTLDWGDGSPVLTNVQANDTTLKHTYTEADAYDLTIDVEGSNGLTGRRVYVVKNQTNPSLQPLLPGNTKGCGPLELEFGVDDNETVLNSPNTTYTWDFGDGLAPIVWTLDSLQENDFKIAHTYNEPSYFYDDNGNLGRRHNFTLVAENSCDASTVYYYEVVVGGGPESYFFIEDSINCVNEPTVIIDQTLIGIFERDERENTQTWDFGDGSPIFTRTVSEPTDLTPIEHTYTSPGEYIVKLTTDAYCQPQGTLNTYTDTVIVIEAPAVGINLTKDVDDCGYSVASVENTSRNIVSEPEIGSYWEIESNEQETSWGFLQGDKWSLEPVFEFMGAGEYTIKYYAINACGSVLFEDTIIVTDKPEINGELPNEACIGVPFITNGLEISINYDPNTTAIWSSNDNSLIIDDSTLLNPTISFTQIGEHQVNLKLSNKCGQIDTTFTIEVYSVPPKPVFALEDTIGCGPFLLRFVIDTMMYKPFEEYNVNFKWDFGNGDTLNQIVPPVDVFLQPGLNDTVYQVSFIVESACITDILTIPVTVLAPPTSRFDLMHEWECSPVNVEFKNRSEGAPETYYWDFGDGNASVKKNPSNLYSTDTLTKTFEIALVTQNLCGIDTVKRDITIRPQTVEAHFSMNPRVVCAGTPVYFQNFSTDTSSFIRKNFWDFGDGNVDTSRNETVHTYMEPGVYYVKLTVNNFCGIDTLIDSVIVEPTPLINILSPDTVCADAPMNFELETDVQLASYRWDFGDGDTSKLTAPEHLYLDEGDYVVGVNVTPRSSLLACSSYAEKVVTIHPSPKDRIFPGDTSYCSPFVYTPKAIGNGGYHLWNFGVDTLVTADPVYRYENRSGQIKKYTVTLVTENDYGCATQDEATVSVLPQPKTGLDSAEIGESPRQLHLFNITQNATNCVWIYENGDSIQSCDDQVRYFSENGNFTIKLITTNQYGCSDADSISYEPGLNSGLYFPNAFAPNLDDQNARVFKAYGIGVREYDLKVYDRWNNVVWETSALNNSEPTGFWDGTDVNGQPLPHGVYYWVCRAKMYGKENEPYDSYNGTVYLIR